jgi:integrase
MNPSRHAPVLHPLAPRFAGAIDSICAPLSPATDRAYRIAVRNFLLFLTDRYPQVQSLEQLQRDPHVLGWLAHLRSRKPPLAPATYILRILLLRGIFRELAGSEKLPQMAYLLRCQDVPHAPQRLPRPLPAEQDQAIQQELLRRNDLAANFFLLLRHTGMRIGEAADLSFDCLRATAPGLWAILVPLGKLKTERMVPVDSSVCALVQRLRFFRSFDPLPPDGLLLARPSSRNTLIRQLRQYLHEVSSAAGVSTRIVPHQLRHTYATEMLRSGVSVIAIMKLLGHKSLDMTMLYLEVALTDVEKEFYRALSQPRHLVPQPRPMTALPRPGLDGLIDSLLYAQHTLEMFRRSRPDGTVRHSLDRIANRLCKILSQTRELANEE